MFPWDVQIWAQIGLCDRMKGHALLPNLSFLDLKLGVIDGYFENFKALRMLLFFESWEH